MQNLFEQEHGAAEVEQALKNRVAFSQGWPTPFGVFR
jgi:hypothetical protein